MNEEAITHLMNLGSCWRCLKLFQGESSIDIFLDKELLNETCEKNGLSENGDGSTEIHESVCKKNKHAICCSCLGILQSCSSDDVVEKLSQTLIDGDYDAPTFSLSLSLPISLGLRIHSIWAYILNKFPSSDIKIARTNHLGVLKDVWRNLIGPKISKRISKDFVSGQIVNLTVSVQIIYANDETECLLLEKINAAKFLQRRQQHRKFNEGVFTRQVVEDTLAKIKDEEFLTLSPEFPDEPSNSIEFQSSCIHTSLFLAGRYNKYSRHLPQTPWFVEDERKLESSVQEQITNVLENHIKSQSLKFSASGREDVDVRCLGNGRPFVVEFINPKRTIFDSSLLSRLQKEVNEATELVAIRDLQVISKKDRSNLKEGEEEKSKSYVALCVSREPVEEDVLVSLNFIENLILEQITPIRVLHRRSLATRCRSVYSMRVERIDDRFFKLFLTTQAGTYIKEFVHGDMGRTVPNLGTLLKIKIDILALDVQDIQLNWPSQIQQICE